MALLLARSCNVLTLSVDKVQRNTPFITETLHNFIAPVYHYLSLVFCSLDRVLRSRHMLSVKLDEMGLEPRIKRPLLLTRVVRMKESRFLKVFMNCHRDDVAGKLMDTEP